MTEAQISVLRKQSEMAIALVDEMHRERLDEEDERRL